MDVFRTSRLSKAASALMQCALLVLEAAMPRAVTISFLTLAFAQLWHVFNMRDPASGIWRNDVTQNPFVWGAVLLCTGLLLAALKVPILSTVLNLEQPGADGWLLIIIFSLTPLWAGQLFLQTALPES